jgi:hypothetical protein
VENFEGTGETDPYITDVFTCTWTIYASYPTGYSYGVARLLSENIASYSTTYFPPNIPTGDGGYTFGGTYTTETAFDVYLYGGTYIRYTSIYVFDVSTGALDDTITLDWSAYYTDYPLEAEVGDGLAFYDGNLYLLAKKNDGSVGVFRIDPETGTPTFLEDLPSTVFFYSIINDHTGSPYLCLIKSNDNPGHENVVTLRPLLGGADIVATMPTQEPEDITGVAMYDETEIYIRTRDYISSSSGVERLYRHDFSSESLLSEQPISGYLAYWTSYPFMNTLTDMVNGNFMMRSHYTGADGYHTLAEYPNLDPEKTYFEFDNLGMARGVRNLPTI